MAVIATEIYGKSESGQITQSGFDVDGDPVLSVSATRMFHVTSEDNTAVTQAQALLATNLPPTAHTITVGSQTLTYWGSRSFSRVDGHNNLWMLTYKYTTTAISGGGGDVIPTERSGSSRATTKGVYRIKVPPPVNPNSPTKADIGGESIDIGGQKTTVVFPSTSLLIKVFSENPVYAWHYAGTVGKRNSNPWNGFPIGVVLFVGANYSQNNSTNLWEIEYEFAIDYNTYHLEQVARTLPGGEVVPERTGNEGEETFTAKHVYWVQPFTTAAFAFPT